MAPDTPVLRGPAGRVSEPFRLPAALADLRETRRWVVWQWSIKADGKWDKPPFRALNPDRHASTSDVQSWAPLDTAERCLAESDMDGIGYVLRDDARHIFLDLDKCRDPATGEIDDWAIRIVEEADTYTEVTPSGTGLRVIGLREWINSGFQKTLKIRGDCRDGAQIELYYHTARYVTVTGQQLEGTPDRLSPIDDMTSGLLLQAGHAPNETTDMPTAGVPNPDARGEVADIMAALRQIPNDDESWDAWSRIGMAVWRATAGSPEGLEAWRAWSARSAKHDSASCDERWRHWFRSPPTRLGFGTLYFLARQANPLWTPPSRKPPPGAAPEPRRAEGAAPGQTSAGAAPDVFLSLGLDELMQLPPVEWLVKGWLPVDAFGIAYGAPGSFKSFLALDLALCVAYGQPWQGCEVKQGSVLYLAAEGVRGLGRRVVAWQKRRGLVGVLAPFRLVPVSVNLTDPQQVAKVVRTALEAAKLEGFPVALVVIDTVARAIAGADENSAQDMGRLVAAVDHIREHCKATVLGIHHSGKDKEKGARGSSALLGAVDTMLRVDRQEGSLRVTLKCEKQKDDEPPEPMTLEGERVPVESKINPDTSLVFAATTSTAAARPDDTVKREAREAFVMEIAQVLGSDGRLSLKQIVEGLKGSGGGRINERIKAAIPEAPGGVEITFNGVPHRLWRSRVAESSKAPIMIACHEL